MWRCFADLRQVHVEKYCRLMGSSSDEVMKKGLSLPRDPSPPLPTSINEWAKNNARVVGGNFCHGGRGARPEVEAGWQLASNQGTITVGRKWRNRGSHLGGEGGGWEPEKLGVSTSGALRAEDFQLPPPSSFAFYNYLFVDPAWLLPGPSTPLPRHHWASLYLEINRC